MKNQDDVGRLYRRKEPSKPAKSYRGSIHKGLAVCVVVAALVFLILMGSKDDLLVKLAMSVAIGGVIGSIIGFLDFKLFH